MGLMTVPFDKLSSQDCGERAELGARRLRETLCSNPWYAKKAAKAAAQGDEMEYWKDFWYSQVNLIHLPVEFSTAETPTQPLIP